MHVHTTYGKDNDISPDAINTPEEIVKSAIKKGLNGIAVTDHDSVKGSLKAKAYVRSIKKDFKIITGSEIKTLSGDILALGIKENVKPLMTVEETVEKIHDLGGIAVAAHPFSAFVFRNVLQQDAIKTDAIEIFNATNSRFYQDSRSMRLAHKYGMPVCAGSDSHSMISVGNAGIICEGDPLECIMKKTAKIFGTYTPYKHIAFQALSKFGRSAKWLLSKQEKKDIVKEINKY